MKTTLTALAAGALTATAIGVAAPANAAQGGWDRSGNPHAWIKIGRPEMNQAGNYPQRNCWSALAANEGSQNRFTACDSLVSGLMAEQRAHPNANGYWAEWYYNGQTRSGVW